MNDNRSGMSILDVVKRHTPRPIRRATRRVKRTVRQRRDAKLTCKEVFTQIYRENRWGGVPGEIYSGPGSGEEAAGPYVEAVAAFIRKMNVQSVVDLGCGDFRVGRGRRSRRAGIKR